MQAGSATPPASNGPPPAPGSRDNLCLLTAPHVCATGRLPQRRRRSRRRCSRRRAQQTAPTACPPRRTRAWRPPAACRPSLRGSACWPRRSAACLSPDDAAGGGAGGRNAYTWRLSQCCAAEWLGLSSYVSLLLYAVCASVRETERLRQREQASDEGASEEARERGCELECGREVAKPQRLNNTCGLLCLCLY